MGQPIFRDTADSPGEIRRSESRVGERRSAFLDAARQAVMASSYRQAGLAGEPIRVFESLSEIALVDVALPMRAERP